MAAAKTNTTKKEEIKLDIPLKGVKAKLQTVRIALIEKKLKKSGDNKFAGFTYYELADFLPEAQKLFAKIGLTSRYTIAPEVIAYEESQTGETIVKKPIIRDMAKLIIADIESEDVMEFKMAAEPVQIGNNTKQNNYQAAGGRSTYYKRYLYRDALELEESDESDAVLGAPEVNYQTPQVTPYSFQTPQAAPVQAVSVQSVPVQSVPVQSVPVQSVPVQAVPVNEVNVQPTEIPTQPIVDNVAPDAPLNQGSREEISRLIASKNLDAFTVLSKYCKEHGAKDPSELKERDKVDLIKFIEES